MAWIAGVALAGENVSLRYVDPARLQWRANPDGGLEFDTGFLSGRLHGGGKSLGLSPITHVPSGKQLDRSNGWLSHYRVFTRGVRYGGGAWDWPSTVRLPEPRTAEVVWADDPARPFTLRALYRWAETNTIEVETLVRAKSNVTGLEVFLASYFDSAFTNALARVVTGDTSTLVAAVPSLGDWLMFTRDAAARKIVEDGRWKLEPNPVNWVFPYEYAKPPMAVRRAPGLRLAAVLSAETEDCFALAMPHQSEGHGSVYLSLFGRDLKAGQIARARTRLVLSVMP